MSQNDFNLANQGFPSMRSDINSALQALATNSSGATAPATPYANQFWYETDTNILHIRDEANTAWLDLMVIDGTTGSPSFNSGNVGIGTTSPSAMLDLSGNNSGNVTPLTATNRLRFTDTDPTQVLNQPTGTIEWYTSDTDSTGVHAYISTDGNNTGAGHLIFGAGSGGAATERVRIRSDTGNVGIGTTSPSTLLDVAGTANATNMTRGGSQVFSRNNILATVTQSAGVPTGGIIERGAVSPTNRGQYIRYADGTQICWSYNAGDLASSSASGNVFRTTTEVTWTFPVAFIEAPVVTVSTDIASRWGAVGAVTSTTVDFRQYSAVTTAATVATKIVAVGRWF